MKDKIIEYASQGQGAEGKMNKLRDALHHLILQEADRKQAFRQICFVGGTALRIVYGLNRFSEDLDFSLSQPSPEGFQLQPLVTSVQKSIEAFGFDCQVERFKSVGTVQSCFFSFRALLYEVDRHFRDKQKLSIKFDIDTRPPSGGVQTTSPITTFRVYKVRHYDLPSLFAGKLHAVLHRTYTKGRDLYDFLWYTGKQVRVNGVLLKSAIEQTQKTSITLNSDEELRDLLRKRFRSTDFGAAKKDVAPFLEDPDSLKLFELPIFLDAVEKVELGKL